MISAPMRHRRQPCEQKPLACDRLRQQDVEGVAAVRPGNRAAAGPHAEVGGENRQPGGELRAEVLQEGALLDSGTVEAPAQEGGAGRFGHGLEERVEVQVARRRPERHDQERQNEQPHGEPEDRQTPMPQGVEQQVQRHVSARWS